MKECNMLEMQLIKHSVFGVKPPSPLRKCIEISCVRKCSIHFVCSFSWSRSAARTDQVRTLFVSHETLGLEHRISATSFWSWPHRENSRIIAFTQTRIHKWISKKWQNRFRSQNYFSKMRQTSFLLESACAWPGVGWSPTNSGTE